MPVECDVLTIGAGFVGLAAGAALASHAESRGHCRIIEQGPCCGAFWHGGHEHLSLHSPHHRLPHDGGLAMQYPMFKTKGEVRDYLQKYAEAHGLDECISFGERVLSVRHCPEERATHPLRVCTDKAEYRCKRVVVATGLNRRPHLPVPACEGIDLHPHVVHSWQVESCSRYSGKRVLLVGSGNSSAELAVALHEAGAASIDILVDAPRHFVRRSTMGFIFSELHDSHLPLQRANACSERMHAASECHATGLAARRPCCSSTVTTPAVCHLTPHVP